MNYNDYSKACDKIKAKNGEYLELFKNALIESGLKEITINRHLSNVDFYINSFLLYEEPLSMDYGTERIGLFLGEFFIRKCMWSTPGSIKSMALSIKKFYKCMADHGTVKNKNYEFLCSEIKDGMETWQATCAAYNDPSEPNPFMFF